MSEIFKTLKAVSCDLVEKHVKMELRIYVKKDYLKTLNFYNSKFKCLCL
jgi:hypothetical protein